MNATPISKDPTNNDMILEISPIYAEIIKKVIPAMFEKKSRIMVGSITCDSQARMNLIYHVAFPQSDELQDYIKEAFSDIVATAIENVSRTMHNDMGNP
eukprot:15335133-Ditylum_brightwellii.AAC.1